MLQLGLSALYLKLDTRRHGSFFSSPSISRYIHGWDTTGYPKCWMACWTPRPSWSREPSSKPTCPYFDWLLSLTGTDSSQRTWPWTLHGFGEFKFSEMLAATNLKLCSPGHVRWNQLKPASFPLENYVSVFQKDWGPNGTSNLTLRIWSFAIATWKVIHFKSPMTWRSCSFWRNTDPNGDSDSTTTSNPLCSSRVLHSLSCYVCDATKLAPVWFCPDTLTSQKRPCLTVLFVAPMRFY